MAKTIGTIGSELNLKFRQGATFGPYNLTIKDAAGLPVNLTNTTFTGKVKKSYTSSEILAQIVFTPVDLINGQVSISIPSTVTANIKGNPNGNADYIWDAEMTDINNQVEPLFYGTVESFANA